MDILKHMELPDFEEVAVTPELESLFMEARTNVVLGSSIYAYTMMRCEYVFTRDIPIAASCVHDDRNIVFFNPDFFVTGLKNSKQRAFVLVHELDHIFFMHQQRCIENRYDHETYNKATDYFINLAVSGVYKNENGVRSVAKRYQDYFEMPPVGLYDEKFLGLNSDEIYERIFDKNHQPAQGQTGFDVTLGNGGTPQKKAENLQTLNAAVVLAEKNNQIGVNEGSLVKAIREMSTPVVSWVDRLYATVRSLEKHRTTYNRISRRSGMYGDSCVIFPSYHAHKIRILFGFDTSGSMCKSDYMKIAGELYGILSQFESWELTLVTCDVKLCVLGTFSSEEGDDFSSVDLKFTGGGGTDMSPIAAYASKLYDDTGDLDACIIVTDGEIPLTVDSEFCPVTTNIVVSTRSKSLRLSNAEVIYV